MSNVREAWQLMLHVGCVQLLAPGPSQLYCPAVGMQWPEAHCTCARKHEPSWSRRMSLKFEPSWKCIPCFVGFRGHGSLKGHSQITSMIEASAEASGRRPQAYALDAKHSQLGVMHSGLSTLTWAKVCCVRLRPVEVQMHCVGENGLSAEFAGLQDRLLAEYGLIPGSIKNRPLWQQPGSRTSF
uniref:Uncharacterized protein n=1 Tax=Eutreptiella gymnastica TaxID=73025 RepID=A0A7S4LIK3_9EUGL